MTITIEAAGAIDVGRVRDLNEDLILILDGPGGTLLAVADGMGGHQAGEVASLLALNSLQDSLTEFIAGAKETADKAYNGDETVPGVTNELEQLLRKAVTTANSVINAYARDNQEEAGNLGCTLTAALLRDDLAAIANVGDSRAYLLRQGNLRQITDDHSYVAELARSGQIDWDDIYDHPQRNVVTRALGSHLDARVDTWIHAMQPGDQLLLCSDGLWEMLRDPAIIADVMLTAEDLEAAVVDLIDLANAYGGVDNIGLIVARAA
jgi:PPM family protein phosphatase